MKLTRAADAWRLLNGIFCVHKPSDLTLDRVKQMIREGLCKDLNQLEIRPPGVYYRPVYKEHPSTGELFVVGHVTQLDYADHPAVSGDRYQIEDIHLEAAEPMDRIASGLCVFGINDGCDLLPKVHHARFMKVYFVKGRLGRATLDFTENSKILEKTTFHQVTRHRISKILTKLLAVYQRRSYDFAGVHVNSQDAYELASKGMVRPREDSQAILYGARCVGMDLPYFTLEIQCINEDDYFFPNFVHELGLLCRSTACLSSLRRMRYGHFTLADHGLLRKHWTLEHIVNNIERCKSITSARLLKPDQTIGTDKLIDANTTKYIDTIPSDFEQIEDSDEIDQERLLLGYDVIEDRIDNLAKSTVPLAPRNDN